MPHFQTKPIAVEAVQLRCSYTFGRAKGRAGDWLVIHADGRQEIVGAQAFAAGYVPVANGDAAAVTPPSRGGGGGQRKPSAGRRPKPAGGRRQKGRGVDPALLARIRQQYEAGVPVAKIDGLTGHSANWIYQLAHDGHWKRGAAAAASKPEPSGEKLRGRVRCPKCESMTEYDPCEHCGKPVKFT